MSDVPAYPGAPRWVKVTAVIGLVTLLLFLILKLSGHHGPARHFGAGRSAAQGSSHP